MFGVLSWGEGWSGGRTGKPGTEICGFASSPKRAMNAGETAREQSPQKVSSAFLLKLAPSCIRNSIFKPVACQSLFSTAGTHRWLGAQCRCRGAGRSPADGQGDRAVG